MDSSLFAQSQEITQIQKQIDWIKFISNELDGNAFGAELEVLEKKKREVMKKIIDEEIARVYPDLAFARAVRHDREKRKVSVRGSEQKEFKGKTSDSLRMMLGLNKMKMKAKDIETRAYQDRLRLVRSAGLLENEIKDTTIVKTASKSISDEKRSAWQHVVLRKRPAVDRDSKSAKKTRRD